jgi:hypothetical protein
MKLLTSIVLLTLSTFTFASEEPKQFAPFSIVTKEVSDKLHSDYSSMVDSIIHISKRTDYAYSEADIKKAATIVATEYSPCKYTQRIDLLECQSTRDDLIRYLTDSVMESPTFKALKKVDVLDEANLVLSEVKTIMSENDRESLSDRVKAILKKGKINGNGQVTFEDVNDKYKVMLVSAMLSNEIISKLYEEILLDDYKASKIKANQKLEEAMKQETSSILKPLIFVSKTMINLVELGLSEKRYSCKYDEDEMTIQCRHDYTYREIAKSVATIWPLVMFLVLLAVLISRLKEIEKTNKDK